MRGSGVRLAALASAFFSLSHASRASAEESTDPVLENPGRAVLVAVDVDSILRGSVPPPLREADAPASASQTTAPAEDASPPGLTLKKTSSSRKRKPSLAGLHAKKIQKNVAELTPSKPELAALYQPTPDAVEFGGESLGFVCGRDYPRVPMRWETLTVEHDGQAQLEIKDLWLDASHCSVNSVSSARVTFKAIAWAGAEPWLFAMRDENSITFLMPRAEDVSAEAMAGAPLTVRGGFTRVTLPMGRWGSSSLVASLPSLALNLPAETRQAGQTRVASEPPTSGLPVEVAIELVQTMAEKSATLLIRRSVPAEQPPAP